jgi:hypothetical protein
MKKLNTKELGELYCELFYGSRQEDVISSLLKENGFTHQRLITDIQTTPNQSDEAKGLDI